MSTSTQPRRLVRRVFGAALACTVLTGVAAIAATPAQAVATSPAAHYNPTRVPDRITLTPTATPETSQYVSWRSSTAVTTGQVEVLVASSKTYRNDQMKFDAESTTITTDLGYDAKFHKATLTGLTGGTTYQYRVGDGTNWSEWQHFTTAKAGKKDFSFLYFGDVQNGIKSQSSRVIRNAVRDRPDGDLMVQAGDIVNDAMSDEQWGEVYDATGYAMGTKNFLMAPGNHEYEGDAISKQFQAQFMYPDNGPQGSGADYDLLKGTVHYNDYQGVRFISLNSNASAAAPLAIQTAWLKGVLENNPNQWTVIYFHHPIFSLDEGRNNRTIREAWLPLFEKHSVDLVLQGHDHAYGRGNTKDSEKGNPSSWDAELSYDGPVYAVSVVGSKKYTAGPRVWNENDAHVRRMGGGLQLYQAIDVSEGKLRYESRTADGQYYDGFTIVKNEHGKAVTDDKVPDVIDPDNPGPCLGCGVDPGTAPGTDPGAEDTIKYNPKKTLKSVDNSMASLPAGVAFSAKRDHVFMGDQNGRKIFEIDPVTDEVKNSMTLPENIRDLGVDDENDLLYVGQQNKNWVVVSTKAETYGQVVRGPFTVAESNRSIDVDPKLGYVYVAIPARGVEVLDAKTGESVGTISGTTGAYYVAADEVGGKVAVAYFEESTDVKNVEVFDAKGAFASKWSTPTRANARQVDVDSTNGLVYVGYTGTSAESGGFSVHSLATGKELADKKGAQYGKDGYGIAVDEERQQVYVSNRDFRLNPAGEETTPTAINVSKRVHSGDTEPGGEEPGEGGGTDPGEGTPDWTATPLTSIPVADDTSMDDKPVGSVVEKSTGNLFVGNEQRPARVRVINPTTDKTVKVLTIPDGAAEGVRDLALDEAKQELYVAYGASWVVVNPADATVIRGTFAFGANVRGIAVDFAGGRVFGAVRGTGFTVSNATTGTVLQTVDTPGANWASHGIAFDATANRVYASNENAAGTVGLRVYKGTDYSLEDEVAHAGPTWRAVDVDEKAGLIFLANSTNTYQDSGVTVLKASDRSQVARLSAHEYGNKVYGISVDAQRGFAYVSARDRAPVGIIKIKIPQS